MISSLKSGQQVIGATSGKTYTVHEELGKGGQGVVFRGTGDGGDVAIKWYFPRSATPQQRLRMEKLIADGPPSNHYLWALDLVTMSGNSGFGYVMPIRPKTYVSISYVKPGASGATLTVIVEACRNLAIAFRQLHLRGLTYFDIKGDNAFFDPVTGEVLIVDIDNITYAADRSQILGTLPYMAPELITGAAKPSAQTDLHSLAVLLFEMLVRNHPLEGKREHEFEVFDDHARRQLYGFEPLFIFDSHDASNRPVPGYHKAADLCWSLLPQFVKDKFIHAFTIGLKEPNKRVTGAEWIDTMVKLQDSVAVCPACSAENYTEPKATTDSRCWHCKGVVPRPLRLLIVDPTRPGSPVKHRIAMHAAAAPVPPTRIFRDHLDTKLVGTDRGAPIGAIEANPNDPRVLGLANLSDVEWSYHQPGNEAKPLTPGKRGRLEPGVEIRFAGSNLVGRVE